MSVFAYFDLWTFYCCFRHSVQCSVVSLIRLFHFAMPRKKYINRHILLTKFAVIKNIGSVKWYFPCTKKTSMITIILTQCIIKRIMHSVGLYANELFHSQNASKSMLAAVFAPDPNRAFTVLRNPTWFQRGCTEGRGYERRGIGRRGGKRGGEDKRERKGEWILSC